MPAVCVRRRSLYTSPYPLTVYYGLDSFMSCRLTHEPQAALFASEAESEKKQALRAPIARKSFFLQLLSKYEYYVEVALQDGAE